MIGSITFLAVISILKVEAFKDNYITHVSPSCGATELDTTTITIRTDMDITATALCKNSPNPTPQSFVSSENDVVHTKTVGTSSGPCQFYKKANAKVYTIKIELSYGEPGAFVHTQQETYLVTCTYDENGINIAESAAKSIDESYVQPMEIQHNMGSASNATFTLQMIDVLGNAITGNVAIGRKVQLEGVLTGGTGAEPGVRAVSCSATSGTTDYAVLRGGCGDGIVFPKNVGFTTSGKRVTSPYFGAFKLSDGSSIQFSCNFTVCTSNCDGDSCTIARRKRNAEESDEDGTTIAVLSQPLEITEKPCMAIGEKKLPSGIIVMAPWKKEKTEPPMNLFVVVMVAIVMIMVVVGCLTAVYVCMRQDHSSAAAERSKADIVHLKA